MGKKLSSSSYALPAWAEAEIASAPMVRCYETHPKLSVTDASTGHTYWVYGGSCSWPVVDDADIYIGLDRSMTFAHQLYPWDEPKVDPVIEVQYVIVDMSVPADPSSFKRMVKWICQQILVGKKVHVGCIGGHGRTGMVLAAIVFELSGNHQAILYVREHYCKKAVEASEQIEFLHEQYGMDKAQATKSADGKGWKGEGAWDGQTKLPAIWQGKAQPLQSVAFSNATRVIDPTPSKKSLWNPIDKP